MNELSMGETLDKLYECAIYGKVPGTDSAIDLANCYLKKSGTLEEKINSLIRYQNAKSVTSGFLTGLGGLITLPLAIPANVASVLYIQIRMIAAIACMTNHDLKDDKVQTMIYMCLGGSNFIRSALKNLGINIITKSISKELIAKVSSAFIMSLKKQIIIKLLVKFGPKNVLISYTKAIPIIGGIVGGTVDGISTNLIGEAAKLMFLEK